MNHSVWRALAPPAITSFLLRSPLDIWSGGRSIHADRAQGQDTLRAGQSKLCPGFTRNPWPPPSKAPIRPPGRASAIAAPTVLSCASGKDAARSAQQEISTEVVACQAKPAIERGPGFVAGLSAVVLSDRRARRR